MGTETIGTVSASARVYFTLGVYDFKFGSAKLSKSRTAQIRDVAGLEPDIMIIEIKPRAR